jgi:phosphopantetheine adenylyltransferase
MKNNLQAEIIEDLTERKKRSREFMRSLSPEEKIARLVELQERYYKMLEIREQNGGSPIPGRWRKWHKARYENKSALE